MSESSSLSTVRSLASTLKDATTETRRDPASSSSLLLKDLTTLSLLAELSSSVDRFGSPRPSQRAKESRSMEQEEATTEVVITTEATEVVMMVVITTMEAMADVDAVAMVEEVVTTTEEEEEAEEVEEDLRRWTRAKFSLLETSTTDLKENISGNSLTELEKLSISESPRIQVDP